MLQRQFDKEHLALLACALAPPGVALDSALAPLLDGTFRWDRLASSARAHRLRPQLAEAMGPLLCAQKARGLREELDAVVRANAGHARFLSAELLGILDSVRLAGARAVAFKGPAFAELVGGGAALREMDDLDLLLQVDDVASAARALQPLGYEAVLPAHAVASPWLNGAGHELAMVRSADRMLVELHWRISPPWFPEPCTPAQVLSHSGRRRFLGADISWPCPEHLLLMHAADAMKSCGRGMRWAGDIAAIVRGHDLRWAEVRDTARSNGALAVVGAALATVDGLCREVADGLALPAIALALPPEGERLVREAQRGGRLPGALARIRDGMARDAGMAGAAAHFRWAMRLADRPAVTALAIGRYLSAPAMADLREMPSSSLTGWSMRWRAARRRLGLR